MPSQQYELSPENNNTKESMPKSATGRKIWMVLLVLVILALLATVIVLAVVIDKNKTKYEKSLESLNVAQQGSEEICTTPSCLQASNRVNKAIDPSVEPCDNFYQFACGGWEKLSNWPYHFVYGYSVLDEIEQDNLHFFQRKLQEPVMFSDPQPVKDARILYKTCMETMTTNALGLSEARQVIDGMGGLHFNTSLHYPDFDLTERILELASLGSFPLFTYSADFHRYEANVLLLEIGQPDPPLLFTKSTNQHIWSAMADGYYKVWNDLYENDTPPGLAVFLESYNILNDLKEAKEHDLVKSYFEPWNQSVSTVDDLNQICPSLNWTRIIDAILPHPQAERRIIISNKAFLIALNVHLQITWANSTRALDNTLKYLFVLQNLKFFPYKYQQFEDNLVNRILFANPFWHPEPRWMFCVNKMKEVMPLVLAHWFVTEYMTSQDYIINDVDDMIERIRAKYIQVLQNTQILDAKTRAYAIKKIRAMEKKIAFPDFLTNLTYIEEANSHIVANDTLSFFNNILLTTESITLEMKFVGPLTPDDREDLWLDNAFVANGYYSANLNTFTILAGILQGAFYNPKNPKYLNYGSMGFTIGHEFTHGFDDTGRHYDVDGLLNSWWTNTSEANFNSIKQCFSKQYSTFEVASFDSNNTIPMNGNRTLDENLADNGAVPVVYQTYLDWIKEHGTEKPLPSPFFKTWQQNFFVALAQGWCAKFSYTGLSLMIDSYAHSQKEARVNGMLMNSADFSEAFQCKPGTNMNPNAKCQLWHLESEE